MKLKKVSFWPQRNATGMETTPIRSALQTLLEKDADLEFINLLVTDPKFLLAGALFPIRREMDFIAKSLVNIFMASQPHLLRFIQYIVQMEINEAPSNSWSELFRSNTIPTKILSDYSYQIGRDFLQKMLAKPIEYIYASTGSFEVNPNRLSCFKEHLAENQNNLKVAVEMFLKSILQASQHCPKQIQQICYYLRASVGIRFRSHADTAVGGFFFLRFICPAVVIPATFQLEPIGYCTNNRIQRGLVLVAKMLQSLANNVLFGPKEPFMTIFNPFIRDNYCLMLSFYDELCGSKPRIEKKQCLPYRPYEKSFRGMHSLDEGILLPQKERELVMENYQPIIECIQNNLDSVVNTIESTLTESNELIRNDRFSFKTKTLQTKDSLETSSLRKYRKNGRSNSLNCSFVRYTQINRKSYKEDQPNPFETVKKTLYRSKSDGALLVPQPLDEGRTESILLRKGRIQSCGSVPPKIMENLIISERKATIITPEMLTTMLGSSQHRYNSVMRSYYSYIANRGIKRLLKECRDTDCLGQSNPCIKEKNGWRYWKELHGVRISRRRIPGSSYVEIRGSGLIKTTPMTVYHLIKDIEGRPKWDKTTLFTKEIEEIDDRKSVVYLVVSGPNTWINSPRDTSLLVSYHEHIQGQNTFAIVAESVCRDDVPPVRGFVRMHVESSGFLIRSSKEHCGYTELIYTVQANPKGWLPNWLKNWISLQQALCISSIRDIIEVPSTC